MLRGKFSVERAHQLQIKLSKQVIKKDTLPKSLHYVAGVDVAYAGDWSIGAAVVLDYTSSSLVEAQKSKVKTSFPYIPTLLSFREIKPSQAAIRKLKTQPDVYLIDAQGIAHPYRLGFASHLGIILDKPTIGVAKSLLCGRVEPETEKRWAPITDKGEIIGASFRSGIQRRPIYVSIGHKVSLERAMEIVEHFTRTSWMPEPIRLAHALATEEKKKHKREITHKS